MTNNILSLRYIFLLLAAWGSFLSLGQQMALAQQEARLIDGEPFDKLTLKKDMLVLKLAPLDLPKRAPLGQQAADYKLHIKLYDKPDQTYEVVWADVEKVELFEELVLAEVGKVLAEKHFDEAYEYYHYLQSRSPDFPGVKEGLTNTLFQEAIYWADQKKLDQALGLLGEVFARDPKWKQLDAKLRDISGELISGNVNAQQYAAARLLLHGLLQKYPEQSVGKSWQEKLTAQAAAQLTEAQKSLAAGDSSQAYRLARAGLNIWPKVPQGHEFLKTLHEKYPRVSVGVLQVGTDDVEQAVVSWGRARKQRLLHRTFIELTGWDARGPVYTSPVAELKSGENTLACTLLESARWSADGTSLSSFDVVHLLNARAHSTSPIFSSAWSDVVSVITAPDNRHVQVELRRSPVALSAWLQAPLVPWYAAWNGAAQTNGPYQRATAGKDEERFVLQAKYALAGPKQPQEVLEIPYADSREALLALVSGEIDVLDRLDPLHLDAAQRNKDLMVYSYAAPTVHLLLPNLNRPLTSQRTFRRGLDFALQAAKILEKDVLGRKSDALGQPLLGMFPNGMAATSLDASTYDPRMLLALGQVALASTTLDNTRRIKLTLAHPPTPVARRACVGIQRMLDLDGQGPEIELKELPHAGVPATMPADCDLLYVEWPWLQPALDARRLFGEEGLQSSAASWLADSVRRLETATTPAALAQEISSLERAVQAEAAVLPLWQLTEHYVARKSLDGLGAGNTSLYQSIEKWQPAPFIPEQ